MCPTVIGQSFSQRKQSKYKGLRTRLIIIITFWFVNQSKLQRTHYSWFIEKFIHMNNVEERTHRSSFYPSPICTIQVENFRCNWQISWIGNDYRTRGSTLLSVTSPRTFANFILWLMMAWEWGWDKIRTFCSAKVISKKV